MLNIVAAENVYGDLARQLGGNYVQVRSILNSPAQDPHVFSVTPSIAKAVADADVVIYNGLAYDLWMEKLLTIAGRKFRQTINVADLLKRKAGDNPHVWYDPLTMPKVAIAITHILQQKDPIHRDYYAKRLQNFQQDYQQLIKVITVMKQPISVISSESVFDNMAEALGFEIVEKKGLAQSIMNHVEPTPSQMKRFEDALTEKKVRVMIYNKQVNTPLTKRLQDIAEKAGVPIVGVAEIPDKDYIPWMIEQLEKLSEALQRAS